MKELGTVRKIDELGRIVIPSELRKVLNMHAGSLVEIFGTIDSIIIKKHMNKCILCGNAVEITSKLKLCPECVQKIKKDKM